MTCRSTAGGLQPASLINGSAPRALGPPFGHRRPWCLQPRLPQASLPLQSPGHSSTRLGSHLQHLSVMCHPTARCDAEEPLLSSWLSQEPSHLQCGCAQAVGEHEGRRSQPLGSGPVCARNCMVPLDCRLGDESWGHKYAYCRGNCGEDCGGRAVAARRARLSRDTVVGRPAPHARWSAVGHRRHFIWAA